jgi:hypothetical protein
LLGVRLLKAKRGVVCERFSHGYLGILSLGQNPCPQKQVNASC